jgi:cyclopropane fatty-acyl-phospholipid synthase-like methyltransferase
MGSAQMQGDLWGTRVRAWADLQEGSFRPPYETAFAAAKVDQGSCVLDVGCGASAGIRVALARSDRA